MAKTVSEVFVKYWFDTEFIEDGQTIDLISIGIVSEDGREFYGISNEFDDTKANNWVIENVFSHLLDGFEDQKVWYTRKELKQAIIEFIGNDQNPEFWAYYASYDWVALCQLFGTMMQLPKHFPMFCMDLKQLTVMVGNPKLPDQTSTEHHALADARWNKEAYDFLMERMKK